MVRTTHPNQHKGDNGRQDCDLCPDDTVGDPILIIFDPRRDPGDRLVRLHLRCFQGLEVVSHWETYPKQRKNFIKKE